jgi:hypothetical protein
MIQIVCNNKTFIAAIKKGHFEMTFFYCYSALLVTGILFQVRVDGQKSVWDWKQDILIVTLVILLLEWSQIFTKTNKVLSSPTFKV